MVVISVSLRKRRRESCFDVKSNEYLFVSAEDEEQTTIFEIERSKSGCSNDQLSSIWAVTQIGARLTNR